MHSYVPRNNIIIVTFYPNGCSQFENPAAPDLKKIVSASSSFSTLSLPSSLPLPNSFIKLIPLPQKINRFRFRFHIPAWNTKGAFTPEAKQHETLSNRKQPKFDVIDSLRNVATGRKLLKRFLSLAE